ERENPKIINGSRRSRIAAGSGRQVSEVNQLVDRFFEARKMMQKMAKNGGMPDAGMPGMPGMPGGSKRAGARQKPQSKKKKNKKKVSGNPAKRAAAENAQQGQETETTHGANA